ncbi:MAG: Fic family protein [Cyanobacteria bacterium SZAS LIN-3]|nr:Fic family protein [Cyanobacteria bacterium SZAS LIN-3]
MFTDTQLAVVRFCAEECERQHSGPTSVSWMVNAYNYAATELAPLLAGGGKLELDHLRTLARLIEPVVNARGFRITPVRFGDGSVLSNHHQIERQLEALLAVQDSVGPGAFYQEYEEIHPCADGNGREGAILFNLLGGTLDQPVVPPPFNRGGAPYQSAFGAVES